jgi:hypothetical protein
MDYEIFAITGNGREKVGETFPTYLWRGEHSNFKILLSSSGNRKILIQGMVGKNRSWYDYSGYVY